MEKKKSKKKTESLIPQARLLKLFQIIAVLKSGHCTIRQLAQRFDSSERTIYRYLSLLEEANFLIEQDFQNRYFIVTSEDDPSQAQFSIEETKLIRKLIQGGAADNPLKNTLLKKLTLNSEIDSMPRLFVKARLGKFVDQLADSIRNKKQVILKNYHSANSNEVRDRLVEPIHFGDNYQSIMALDTHDKVCKQFKLDRIGEVVELDHSFAFEELHKTTTTDIFSFSGDSNAWVTLRLSMKAYLLLREEYPLSIPYVEKKEDHYQFHGPVASFEGIGRFVMGLLDEIQVVGTPAFIDFLKNKLSKPWVRQ
jgi:predicted DNA-binding transcriptional regulator YafY